MSGAEREGDRPESSPGVFAIRVLRLRVVRAGRVVIPGLTVDVPYGQVVGLLGPSGCGKTTLMRSIVDVQVVSGGEIEVLGRPAGHPDLRHVCRAVRSAGCHWLWRYSVYPSFWCSTNRRSASTPCSAATCGRSSIDWRPLE
jgi:ABC-type polar amino acid transport system ATPase subunit